RALGREDGAPLWPSPFQRQPRLRRISHRDAAPAGGRGEGVPRIPRQAPLRQRQGRVRRVPRQPPPSVRAPGRNPAAGLLKHLAPSGGRQNPDIQAKKEPVMKLATPVVMMAAGLTAPTIAPTTARAATPLFATEPAAQQACPSDEVV